MSDLKYVDQLKFEKLFKMDTGYVLNFSNRTFRDFVISVIGKDIYDEKYNRFSGSKANRLRAFWEKESNFLVAKLNQELLKYWKTITPEDEVKKNQNLYEECLSVVEILKDSSISEHIDAIKPNSEEEDFKLLVRSIRDSIEKNEPEAALDRLHTYIAKFIKNLCKKHGIDLDKSKPLHSFFGEYVKFLKNKNLIESQMTERILKSSISLLEAFNKVRNDQSFAHDNPILNYNESLLIFKTISSVVEFIESIEHKIDLNNDSEENLTQKTSDIDDLPF